MTDDEAHKAASIKQEYFTAETYRAALEKMNDRLIEQGMDPKEPRELVRRMKIGRNDPCPCGSGRKFKKCCIHKAR